MHWVGIDVAKDSMEVFVGPSRRFAVENTSEGLAPVGQGAVRPRSIARATHRFQRFFLRPSAFLAASPVMPAWLRRYATISSMVCPVSAVVAFACKGRGFCPSCLGRRMAATAANLVECVLPTVALRQWVLTVPFPGESASRTTARQTS